MTVDLRDRIIKILEAVRITSPTCFVFAGQRFDVRHDHAIYPPRGSLAEALCAEVTIVLYNCCYVRHFNGTPTRDTVPLLTPDMSFIERLSQANQTRDGWDGGWQVQSISCEGVLQLEKGSRIRTAQYGGCKSASAAAPQLGSIVYLPVHREARALPLGFYFAFGETLPADVELSKACRFYFNSHAKNADALLRWLSCELNRADIPFAFKCLASPVAYDRADACVLYVARRYAAFVAESVCSFPDQIQRLRPSVPLFCNTIVPGVGWADDPGDGESFGMHRCRLLAEAIVDAHRNGRQTTCGQLQSLRERFAAAGLDLNRPYLNAASVDLEPPAPRAGWRSADSHAAPVTDPTIRFLHVADRIGCRLARDALWAGDRCNWVGRRWEMSADGTEIVSAAHDPSLLAGTAGIGLFLARLFARTGDSHHRVAAQGALRQALDRAVELDEATLADFYHGPLGIAIAGIAAAAELRCQEFHDAGWRVVRQLTAANYNLSTIVRAPCATAATVVGLLQLARRSSDEGLVQLAVRFGDILISTASTEFGPCWPCHASHLWPETERRDASLEVARALLELYLATALPLYRDLAATAAMRVAGDTVRASAGPQNPNALAATGGLCFQGPLSALSWYRCREFVISPAGPSYPEDFPTANWRHVPQETAWTDFSLGSGLAGHCELLLTAAASSGNSRFHQQAEAIGNLGIQYMASSRLPWPCPTGSGDDTYSLISGQAGIGHAYLRLADPNLPHCFGLCDGPIEHHGGD